MNHGLSKSTVERIVNALRSLGCEGTIVLFGSRAKGNWREGSDIDIAVSDPGLDVLWAAKAKDHLEEAVFPYSFDVIALSCLKDQSVRNHIERLGLVLAEPPSPRS